VTITCVFCSAAVSLKGALWARCPQCQSMIYEPTGGPEVLVAHESDTVAARIGVVLASCGLRPLHAGRGATAWSIIEKRRPPALVLDVALGDIMSFQIIERVRQEAALRDTKIVLVASVFNRAAYKRRPISLYGADDYVEQHHVHDFLPQKVCTLLQLPVPTASLSKHAIDGQDTRVELPNRERVRALARSIVADIALYHREALARVARGEDSVDLAPMLAEGRRILAEMLGANPADGDDPVGEAYAAMMAEMRGVLA